jgi:hypothetical protein
MSVFHTPFPSHPTLVRLIAAFKLTQVEYLQFEDTLNTAFSATDWYKVFRPFPPLVTLRSQDSLL